MGVGIVVASAEEGFSLQIAGQLIDWSHCYIGYGKDALLYAVNSLTL
jgi:hypothetical protein